MKKLLCLLLSTAICFSLAGCGGSDKSEDNPDDATGGVAVDENLLTVDITLPASMFEDEDDPTEFDPDAYAQEQGFKKAVLNEDGSVTVTMTKARHRDVLKETAEDIDASYAEMVGAEDTPYIKEITHTDDFKSVNVMVDNAGFSAGGLQSAFIPFVTYVYAGVYQLFSGDEPHVEISIIDSETGDVLSSVIYPDALENKS